MKHDPLETIEYDLVEARINSKNYIIGSVYRAPNTNQRSFLKEYNILLNLITSEKPYGIVLGMDHNMDLLKCETHSTTQDFIECNANHDLFPSINRPTRITKSSATLIDNIFLSGNFCGNYYSTIIVDDISDHLPCVTILENETNTKRSKRKLLHMT